MRDVSSGQEPTRPGTRQQDPLEELRKLIVRPEQDQLSQLRRELEDPRAQATRVSQILPRAISLRPEGDRELLSALQPTIEETLRISVRKNPQALVDALFPVMGPAIRKAIRSSLMAMVQTLNQAIEHSLTPRGLRWRLEAWRTGRPFAEVVLLRTLIYRVEQVFLIHRKTGLVLAHVSIDPSSDQDPSLVSAMLTAIQDFVQDSFRSGEQSLEEVGMGDLSLWLEQGSQAFLAGVIRGRPRAELRSGFQEALERIHQERSGELSEFDGDSRAFESIRPWLEELLTSSLREAGGGSQRWGWLGVLGSALALLVVLVWAVNSYWNWSQALDSLRAEPGIALTQSSWNWGRGSVAGLRDPLARPPQEVLFQARWDAQSLEQEWVPYYSLDPQIVLRRAGQSLQPPESVSLSFNGDVLSVSGQAEHRWIQRLQELLGTLPGVAEIDRTGLVDTDLQEAQAAKERIESMRFLFPEASATSTHDSQSLDALAGELRRLLEAARRSGAQATVEVIGTADLSGSERFNRSLSQRRADSILNQLVRRGIDRSKLTARGLGSSAATGTAPDDRRVAFHVEIAPDRSPRR